jgi:pimeloyl-ACP methyl ester carboxylesterase
MNSPIQQEPTEGFISLPEGKLHYLDWGGRGLQLHFLHANGFCAGTYSPFLKYLIDDYHVLASDVRGHGNSIFPRSRRIRNWEIFADDLKRIIEQAMSAPIIGMGHSLGAVTTYIAAAKFPHLFSGIILLDPVIFSTLILWRIAIMRLLGLSRRFPLAHGARQRKRTFKDKQSALKRFAAGRGIFKTWSKEFIEAYLQCGLLVKDSKTALLRCDPELEAQIFESVPINIWKYAKHIHCPVLVIRGERTDTFLPEAADRLIKIIPKLEVVSIPNSGHFVPMEKPQECARLVADFIHRNR